MTEKSDQKRLDWPLSPKHQRRQVLLILADPVSSSLAGEPNRQSHCSDALLLTQALRWRHDRLNPLRCAALRPVPQNRRCPCLRPVRQGNPECSLHFFGKFPRALQPQASHCRGSWRLSTLVNWTSQAQGLLPHYPRHMGLRASSKKFAASIVLSLHSICRVVYQEHSFDLKCEFNSEMVAKDSKFIIYTTMYGVPCGNDLANFALFCPAS